MFLPKCRQRDIKGKEPCRNREKIKENSDSEMVEFWTWHRLSHGLFRACQCIVGNRMSDTVFMQRSA